MSSNALSKKMPPSLEETLTRIETQWQAIGLTKKGVGKEVFKAWMDEVGWKMAIVTLMELQQSDPKAFLQAFSALGEYVSPKSVRKDGDKSNGLSINFTLPSSDKKELPPSDIQTHVLPESNIEPIQIVIADRSGFKSN
ncbi:MAG: hypothetical protein JSS79_05155 [Bacteroidetes bacterium]|nr:hypothetical protein [Bacteroidota bacterium]